MTLHEAMVRVLEEHGALPAAEIAQEINRRELYMRKDRQPVPSPQISARVNKYPRLFVRRSGKIALRGGTEPIQRSQSKSTGTVPDMQVHTAPSSGIEGLKFHDIGSVGDLIEHGVPKDEWLNRCGIYRISVPPGYMPAYIAPEQAAAKGNVIRPWSIEELERKWVPGADVIYIGLAGSRSPRSLRARLRDLVRHAAGRASDSGPHKGGEILWQLRDYESFRISAAATDGPPIPRQLEKGLLAQFMVAHGGSLPFANRQR